MVYTHGARRIVGLAFASNSGGGISWIVPIGCASSASWGSLMGDRNQTARYLENWQDEVDSASEYRAMAAGEPDPRLAKV
jgi:hypothetical protein